MDCNTLISEIEVLMGVIRNVEQKDPLGCKHPLIDYCDVVENDILKVKNILGINNGGVSWVM